MTESIAMTTQTLAQNAIATESSLIKRIGLAAYRLLERMTESAYRHHSAYLYTRYGI